MRSPFRGEGFWDLQSEMDRLFDQMVGDLFAGRRRGEGSAALETAPMAWTPPLEAFARDGDLVIHADLAGVVIEDVDITLQDNALTISGTRKEAPEEVRYYLRELPYGEFRRSVMVSTGVDPDSIKARLENGILEVVLPGAVAEAQPRRIAIEGVEARPGKPRTIAVEDVEDRPREEGREGTSKQAEREREDDKGLIDRVRGALFGEEEPTRREGTDRPPDMR